MHLLEILALLGVALIASKLLGGVFQRVGIPTVLAELGMGILIGNLALFGGGFDLFSPLETSELIKALAEIGVLLLLFLVGLETDIKEIGKVGKDSAFAAFFGVAAPCVLAFLFVPMIAETNFNHTLFMATALTATSVGITARVLQDLGNLKSISGRIILGAAVIDDILGIIILTAVTAIVMHGTFSGGTLAVILGKVALFGIGVLLIRTFILPKAFIRVRPLEISGTITVFLFSLVMIFAWIAEGAGLAGIIGAFALGLVLDDVHFKGFKTKAKYTLEHLMKPSTDFLIPIFFIYTGMSVKLSALMNPDALLLAFVLTAAGIVGKVVCGLAISTASVKKGADRLLIGYGMIPRGEVGLIFAAMGQQLKILDPADYAAVVIMVAVTTLLAPILLAHRARSEKKGKRR